MSDVEVRVAGTIVCVDSEPDLPEGLERELARLGFRLEHTDDLDEALARTRRGTARLLIVEPLMQEGRGWNLVQCVRRLPPPEGQVPVVVLTRGERTPKLYGRAVELGADDFLARPVLRSEVLAAILECIEAGDAPPPVDPLRAGAGSGDEAVGSLAEFPLAELLLRLRIEGATGVLFLQDFEGLVVQLRNGSPVAVASSRGEETFAEFLMRTKRISAGEHERLLERAHAAGETEPEAAVSIRALSRRDVQAALADAAAEPLLEAFAWADGSWRFEHGRRLRAGRELQRAGVRVLVQGILQWMPAERVRSMLDRRGALYLSRVDRPPFAFEELSPAPCEAELLDRWAGDETLAQVLDAGSIGERELYALLVAGLVEARAEALVELEQVVSPDPAAADEPILELDEPCDGPLEAPREEPDAAVAGTPLPDEASSAVSPAARDAAPTDPDTPGGASAAAAEPPSEADRAREAERQFAEGERHLAAKRYGQAVEAFGMSAHLDPSQGTYHAHLGYALHLQSPTSDVVRREALEHIAKGVKLGRDEWRPLLYLGRVFLDAGEHENARKVLLNAIQRHPECEPLREELRRLRQRQDEATKPTGLLGKLRHWWGR